MKATGIVRRIDDLGRVVIPKEIRRTMRIREGDPLEIYTNQEGEVVFKKYSPVGELSDFASQYADVMARACGMPVLICDRDKVIAAAGLPKKEWVGAPISSEFDKIAEERTVYLAHSEKETVCPTTECDRAAGVVAPILAAGDLCGAVCLMMPENGMPTEADARMAQVAAGFLGKQMES